MPASASRLVIGTILLPSCVELERMGFGLWIDQAARVAWAQGTHEYRPLGAAAVAITDQFRLRDFRQTRRRPAQLNRAFAGFFGSLEEVNQHLRSRPRWRLRRTPIHVR